MKKLILAGIIVFGGVLIWGLYFEYGIVAKIIPAMLVVAIYGG